MSQIQYVDSLVREYLVFRGFSNTLKTLDVDLKNDKDKGFRVDKIIEQIMGFINAQDLQSLRDLWVNLDKHLFCKLEHSFASAVRKLENGIFKMYLVIASAANKQDKVSEFFAKLSGELQQQPEWKEWFYFPFCKNPEEHHLFSVYFSKQWQDTLLISLHNFLATIFQCMPQPTLSKIEHEGSLVKRLQEENTALKNRLQSSPSQPGTSVTTAEQKKGAFRNTGSVQSLNDIQPFDVSPPGHIIDDFYIIAAETANLSQMTDHQSRGLKSLIRNIGSGNSPVLGRKDEKERSKRRSGSVGRNWM